MEVVFNGATQALSSVDALTAALKRFDLEREFELWISAKNGASMSMLRNGDQAWLMYLRFDGDDGFVSSGDRHRVGQCTYVLANGEVNEHPLSWCVDIDRCYQAFAYFLTNDGARPAFIDWQKG